MVLRVYHYSFIRNSVRQSYRLTSSSVARRGRGATAPPLACRPKCRKKNTTFLSPKMKLVFQKNAKFSNAGGSAPRTPSLRQLGAPPPNPQFPAAGGFAPRPPLTSSGWGLRPQTQKQPPIANFWLHACLQV